MLRNLIFKSHKLLYVRRPIVMPDPSKSLYDANSTADIEHYRGISPDEHNIFGRYVYDEKS